MTAECPKCGEPVANDARVCRHCLHIIDREHWQHDAGRLGADQRGGGKPLDDAPVGPLPVTGSGVTTGASDAGLAGGALNSGVRLFGAGLLTRRRRRNEERRRGDASGAG